MKTSLWLVSGIVLMGSMLVHEPALAAKKKRKKEDKKVSIYDVDSLMQPIPNNRASFHILIDREQKRADASDGAVNERIYFSEEESATRMLSRAILRDVDQIQVMIENMPASDSDRIADNMDRIRYLRSLQTLVKQYNQDGRVNPDYYRQLVSNKKQMIIARHEGRLNEFVQQNVSIHTLDNADLLEGFPEAYAHIYREMGLRDPRMMIRRLREFAHLPFADEVVAAAARLEPTEIYSYAVSTDAVKSGAVRRNQDPLVKTIVRIASQSKSPLRALPFIQDIQSGKKTVAEVDAITANPELFYKNLVRLKIEQADSEGGDTYSGELRFRALKYVRTINELHDSPDAVRFKVLEGFSPEELYYVMIYGQDEIYTSSYLGAFKRMMERMKPMKGDQLLEKLHYDRFRTFIRMNAGYNTLSQFLATIDEPKKNELMRSFIANLERGRDDELEDAVDVADAFGSIQDPNLANFLKQEVKMNYERCGQIKSKKGIIVYSLLTSLFRDPQKADSTSLDISREVGLPPINLTSFRNLVSDSGTVYQQFYFYGDKDGEMSYASFKTNFTDRKLWKVVENKHWITIYSNTGRNVVIYANKPLPEPEDETAQDELNKYLASKNINPTIVVHRGHSYHLPTTLDNLKKQTRIVVLGSCGGYHNLATVLDHSPDANIISTKQVGTMHVNEPIIAAINNSLLAGEDIDWIKMWRGLSGQFQNRKEIRDMFNDYVPPHKNLGAIFIKAYRRLALLEASAAAEDEDETAAN